jgi:Glycosyl transferases group 1
VRIGYFSSTRTHNRDFLEVADALLWMLRTYSNVELVIVSKIDLDTRFNQFGKRVDRVPMKPWRKLPRPLRNIDVTLAPLERGERLTERKSCVKYLEAALVAVPTVASARPDFMIDDGRNGFLADHSDVWRAALAGLIESRDLRCEVGKLAYEACVTITRRAHVLELCNTLSQR